MYPVESVVAIFEKLDGASLSAQAFVRTCVALGWEEPLSAGDGARIGVWEVEHPAERTLLTLDTLTVPTTVICRLDAFEDDEPEALLEAQIRRDFDETFERALQVLQAHFDRSLGGGTYEPPFEWRYAHFEGLNSIIALEQTAHDPVMGVQLLLLLQPRSLETPGAGMPITSTW